jgi:hypothetical protein
MATGCFSDRKLAATEWEGRSGTVRVTRQPGPQSALVLGALPRPLLASPYLPTELSLAGLTIGEQNTPWLELSPDSDVLVLCSSRKGVHTPSSQTCGPCQM